MAHLIVQDVTILGMMGSTLIMINHVDCAHCAHFSIKLSPIFPKSSHVEQSNVPSQLSC